MPTSTTLPYRVRVYRLREEWVEIIANTPQEAETRAAALPLVQSVFRGSAVRGDLQVGKPLQQGLEEE